MEINEQIGFRLKIARKAAGYKSALDFATKNNIPPSTYSQHEAGKRALTPALMINYSALLNITSPWLLTGVGHPCPDAINSSERKKIIEEEAKILDGHNKVLQANHCFINKQDQYSFVNLNLLGQIFTKVIGLIQKHDINIPSHEIYDFCIKIYNSTEKLSIDDEEKVEIVDLSLESMVQSNNLFTQQNKKQA